VIDLDNQMSIMYEKAERLSKWGKTKEALKEAEQFLSNYPDSHEGYQLLSNIYFNAKEYEKAVQFAKEALNLDPMNFEILAVLTLAYYELGLYEEHEEINELMISEYPDYHYTYAMHAQFLFHDKNEYEKSRFYIEKAVELEPDDPFSLVVYSEILAVFFEDGLSRACSDRALAQNADDAMITGMAASAAYRRGDYAQALTLNKTALQINPNNPGIVPNLALYNMCNFWFMKYPLKVRRFHEKLRVKKPVLFWPLLVIVTLVFKWLMIPYVFLVYSTPYMMNGLAGALMQRKLPEQMRGSSVLTFLRRTPIWILFVLLIIVIGIISFLYRLIF